MLLGELLTFPAGFKAVSVEGVESAAQLEVSLALQVVEAAEKIAVCIGVAVRRKAHNLILIAQPVGEQPDAFSVECSQRLVKVVPGEFFELSAGAAIYGRRVLFPARIHDNNERLFHAGPDVGGHRM